MPLKVTVWPFDLFISLSRRFCFCSEVPVLTSPYPGLLLNSERVYPMWPVALLKIVLNGIRACDRRILLAAGSGRPQAATPLCSACLSRPLRFVRVQPPKSRPDLDQAHFLRLHVILSLLPTSQPQQTILFLSGVQ